VRTVHLALLRAVNVGGHGQVAMSDLRRLAVDLGLSDVRTFLQTGNLLFRAEARPSATIERLLEAAARKELGVETEFIVRDASEWSGARERNPFPQEAREDPAHLVVVFLKSRPVAGGEKALRDAIRGPERVRVIGSQAYLVYPQGIARSRLTLPLVEKHLASRGTGRNWNTVTRLAAMAAE
jgi:uncharacterized protein (DUF1697 family)